MEEGRRREEGWGMEVQTLVDDGDGDSGSEEEGRKGEGRRLMIMLMITITDDDDNNDEKTKGRRLIKQGETIWQSYEYEVFPLIVLYNSRTNQCWKFSFIVHTRILEDIFL